MKNELLDAAKLADDYKKTQAIAVAGIVTLGAMIGLLMVAALS